MENGRQCEGARQPGKRDHALHYARTEGGGCAVPPPFIPRCGPMVGDNGKPSPAGLFFNPGNDEVTHECPYEGL